MLRYTKFRPIQLALEPDSTRGFPLFRKQLIWLVFFLASLTSLGCAMKYAGDLMPSYEILKALTTPVQHYDQLPPFDDSGPPVRPRPLNCNKILLVTSFYPLASSKHSLSDYRDWMSHFFRRIETDIVLFTTPALAPVLWDLRGGLSGLGLTIITDYESPFDIPPLDGMQTRYEAMNSIDPEASIHNAELYAIWNAKPFFMSLVSRSLAQGKSRSSLRPALTNIPSNQRYDYFFWHDAGALRGDHPYKSWPSRTRLDMLWEEAAAHAGTNRKDMIYWPTIVRPEPVWSRWNSSQGPINWDRALAVGTSFGGPAPALQTLATDFYHYHNQWLEQGYFVGKDQELMNALLFLKPSNFLVSIQMGDAFSSNYGWFYYHYDLATQKEQRIVYEGLNGATSGLTLAQSRQNATTFIDVLRSAGMPDYYT